MKRPLSKNLIICSGDFLKRGFKLQNQKVLEKIHGPEPVNFRDRDNDNLTSPRIIKRPPVELKEQTLYEGHNRSLIEGV